MRAFLLDGLWAARGRMKRLGRELDRRGMSSEVFAYDASGRTRFDVLAGRLIDAIERSAEDVAVVGFSMGGLVIRAAAMLRPDLPIRRAVFLNVPHNGTWMAWTIPFGAIGQMRPSDPFVRRLREMTWTVPTLAVWCPYDAMVVPGSSARWSGATETACCRVPAHIWPVFSPSWHRRIADYLTIRE